MLLYKSAQIHLWLVNYTGAEETSMKTILHTFLLKQQIQRNYMRQNITVSILQLGQTPDPKDTKRPKKPNCYFWGAWSKCATAPAPLYTTTSEVSKTPKPSLLPGLLDTPLPSPHLRKSLPPLRERAKKGTCCLFSPPPSPIRSCLDFLSGL